MRSILEELFYGNVCPQTECQYEDDEEMKLVSLMTDYHDSLQETLTEKQNELLEKFVECYNKLAEIDERNNFVYAFKLGAQITLEALCPICDR